MSAQLNEKRGRSMCAAIHSPIGQWEFDTTWVGHHLPAVKVLPTPGLPWRRNIRPSPFPTTMSTDDGAFCCGFPPSTIGACTSSACRLLIYIFVRDKIVCFVSGLSTRLLISLLSNFALLKPVICNSPVSKISKEFRSWMTGISHSTLVVS